MIGQLASAIRLFRPWHIPASGLTWNPTARFLRRLGAHDPVSVSSLPLSLTLSQWVNLSTSSPQLPRGFGNKLPPALCPWAEMLSIIPSPSLRIHGRFWYFTSISFEDRSCFACHLQAWFEWRETRWDVVGFECWPAIWRLQPASDSLLMEFLGPWAHLILTMSSLYFWEDRLRALLSWSG